VSDLLRLVMSHRARVGAIADLLVVILIGFAGARLVIHATRPTEPLPKPLPMLQPGSVLSVPGIVFSSVRQTVVLFALHQCFASQESVGFYKKLTQRLGMMPDFAFIVLSPDSPDVMRAWLAANGLGAELVAQVRDPSAVGLHLSPTLLVVNGAGIVDTVLAARLSPADENTMLARLVKGPTHDVVGNVPDEIDEGQLVSLQQAGPVQLVDATERAAYLRSHRKGSVNIPLPELPVRARIELLAGRRLILDCPPEIALSCPAAGTFLRKIGFGHVSLLYRELDAR
jgi:rhodanese-related sulfurtransferase